MIKKMIFLSYILSIVAVLSACEQLNDILENTKKIDNISMFKQEAEQYLADKYEEEFIVNQGKKECIADVNPDDPLNPSSKCSDMYSATAHAKAHPQLTFTVKFFDRSNFFDDNYLETYIKDDFTRLAKQSLHTNLIDLQISLARNASYKGKVSDYEKILPQVPYHVAIELNLLHTKDSVDQTASQLYRFIKQPKLQTLNLWLTVKYYPSLPSKEDEKPLITLDVHVKDFHSIQDIKEKLEKGKN